MTEHIFEVEGLHASAGGREVLHGIDLVVKSGEVHVIMGPNGAGKSTLSHALMGRPGTTVTAGSIRMDGRELADLPSCSTPRSMAWTVPRWMPACPPKPTPSAWTRTF
jgi:Fe-S cluster assembly ATPase SufC